MHMHMGMYIMLFIIARAFSISRGLLFQRMASIGKWPYYTHKRSQSQPLWEKNAEIRRLEIEKRLTDSGIQAKV